MWGEWCRVRGCWLEPQAEYQSTGHWVDQYWLIHGATLLPPTTGTSKNSSQEFITVSTFTTNKKLLNTKLSKYKFCLWLETTEKVSSKKVKKKTKQWQEFINIKLRFIKPDEPATKCKGENILYREVVLEPVFPSQQWEDGHTQSS